MDRGALELSLWMLRGVAAAHIFGISSAEAEAALLRAHALLSSVPQHPMRGQVFYGLCFVLCLRGKYAEAMVLAERVDALSRQSKDPALILGSCMAHGQIEMLRGRPRISREWLERGLTVTEMPGAVTDTPSIGDPVLAVLGHLAVQLIDLGLIGQARARLDELRARSRQLVNPLADCVAIWLQALCEIRLGDGVRVAELAREMEAIVEQIPFAHGHVACRLFGGWAEAQVGDALSGYRAIRDAYEENLRLGMRAGSSETLGYAAEALLHAGDPAGAAAQLDEALQIADELGERVYLPQLRLIEAAIADARGDPQAARMSIHRALAEARDRGAAWHELLAMLELCKRPDATPEDYSALAVLLDSLPEASDTLPVATARALLEQRS